MTIRVSGCMNEYEDNGYKKVDDAWKRDFLYVDSKCYNFDDR